LSIAVPYVLVAGSALAAIEERLLEAARAWRARWGLTLEDLSVACVRASGVEPVAGPGWRSWSRAGRAIAWHRVGEGLEPLLARRLFADESPVAALSGATLCAEIAGHARDDLIAALLGAFGEPQAGEAPRIDPAVPPRSLHAMGAGAISVCIRVEDVLVELLGHAAGARASARAPATPVSDPSIALSEATLTVSAEIGCAEVEVAELHALAPGDVIRLRRGLDRPVAVVGPDGTTLCHGHLGTHEGALALDVIP
jgi:flagellar motor switch/type III secretory pathway protein FliN